MKTAISSSKYNQQPDIEESAVMARGLRPPSLKDNIDASNNDMATTLGHYLERIDFLTKENEALRSELKHGGTINMLSADSKKSYPKDQGRKY